MTTRTFKVRIFSTEIYKGKRGTTYTVRWSVDGKKRGESFKTKALADSFRASLLAAANNGEPFDAITGRPISQASTATAITWYEFALQYAEMKWPRTSGHSRIHTAKALTKVTIALLRTQSEQSEPIAVRTALREYAFNLNRRDQAPSDVRTILSWVRRNSLPMSAWEDAKHADAAMLALGSLLDGSRAAANTVRRDRRTLSVAMKYAVRQGIFKVNPLPSDEEHAVPKMATAVDKRSLLNPYQVASLLSWIGKRRRTGYRLRAFFAAQYYIGTRPEEAVALRVADATLPEEGWGEICRGAIS
ncbi:hypothetical protein AB0K89_22880 [Streptomyces cinnamoneus]|uniref:hypothetical protein n=1 Tax=Streptomyces cinnamoneus TaxID=53446 RepID=UPI003427979D